MAIKLMGAIRQQYQRYLICKETLASINQTIEASIPVAYKEHRDSTQAQLAEEVKKLRDLVNCIKEK